jgi:hypothetical protein
MLKYKAGGTSRCANNTVNCGFAPRLKRWKARRLNHPDHCAAGTRTSGSRTVDVFWNCLRGLASTQVPHRTLHISKELRSPHRCRDRLRLSGGRGSELLVDTTALLPASPPCSSTFLQPKLQATGLYDMPEQATSAVSQCSPQPWPHLWPGHDVLVQKKIRDPKS